MDPMSKTLSSLTQVLRQLCLAAGADFGDQKLCEWLPVSVFPLVMLFGFHLVYNDLFAFQLLQDFCLNSDIFQIRFATREIAIVLCC